MSCTKKTILFGFTTTLFVSLLSPVALAKPAAKPVAKKVAVKAPTKAPTKVKSAKGATLGGRIPHLLQVDNRIKAAWNDLEADRFGIHKAVGEYLPKFDITIDEGRQRRTTTTEDTDWPTNSQKFEVTQLVYDFGKTTSDIKTAEDVYKKSKVNYKSVRQDTMLDGATAYLRLLGAYETLSYASRYEGNVGKQVRMEQVRRKRGSGYSTDVLEVQAQLSGAKARVSRAQGALVNAQNAYRRTFHESATELSAFAIPTLPTSSLPKTKEAAIAIALRTNPDIQKLEYDIKIDRAAVTASASEFAPSIDLKTTADYQHDVSGVQGQKKEWTTEVEATYPLINGGSDIAALKAAHFRLEADQQRLDDQRRVTEEEVSDDWDGWQTSLESAVYLKQQSAQLHTFVSLAEKERRMGRKDLLAVLVADSNYINAISDSVDAQVNVAIDTYTLLRHMGVLNETMFVSPKKSQHFEKMVQDKIVAKQQAKKKMIQAKKAAAVAAVGPTTHKNTRVNTVKQPWHTYTRPSPAAKQAAKKSMKRSQLKAQQPVVAAKHQQHAATTVKHFDWI